MEFVFQFRSSSLQVPDPETCELSSRGDSFFYRVHTFTQHHMLSFAVEFVVCVCVYADNMSTPSLLDYLMGPFGEYEAQLRSDRIIYCMLK